jgi:hypothetical protein
MYDHIKRFLLDGLVWMYERGPWWLGCWSFVPREDICAALSRSS